MGSSSQCPPQGQGHTVVTLTLACYLWGLPLRGHGFLNSKN